MIAAWVSPATGQDRASEKSRAGRVALCYSGDFSFPCPADYKVLIKGVASQKLFFARNNKFDYGVFVLSEPGHRTVSSELPTILKAFVPSESQKFKWKEVVPDSRQSSKFETGKGRLLGSNGNKLVTIEFREVKFDGKSLLTGTIVNGFEKGTIVESAFNEGRYTTNGGCFDSLSIIHKFTGEEETDEMNPCIFSLGPVK